MKRLILGCLVGLLARIAGATCDPSLTPASTTRVGLQVPQINSCSWGTVLNNNFSILDSSVACLACSNTFTTANQFNSSLTMFGGGVSFYDLGTKTKNATIQNLTTNKNSLIMGAQDGIYINGNYPSTIGIPADLILGGYGANNYGAIALATPTVLGNVGYVGFQATGPLTASTLWTLPKNDGTNGQLLGTDGGAHLSWFNNSGGGGGGTGGNPLTVNQNAVQITSPTLGINALSPPFLISSVGGGTTAQWRLDGSSATLEGPLLTTGNSWTGFNNFAASTTFAGNVNISSGVLILNSAGTNGQVLTSGGPGAVPAWLNAPTNAILNQNSLQSGSTFFVSSGTVAGNFYVNGNGDGKITLTIGASTATVIYTSAPIIVGQSLVYLTTSGAVGGGSGGAGTPGGSSFQLQYNNAGIFGGISNTNVWSSSVTVSTFGVLSNIGQTKNLGFNGTNGPGLFDIFNGPGSTNQTLFDVGSSALADQFYIPNNHYPIATLGIQSGQLIVGDTSASGQRIYSNGDINSFFDLRNGSTMTLNTGTANGFGDIRLQPGGVLQETLSSKTGNTFVSTLTVLSNPSSANAAIIVASGSVTTGVGFSDPDFFQAFSQNSTNRQCLGFRTASDNNTTNPNWAICRAGNSVAEMDFGFRGFTGGMTIPLNITTNGNFPTGSTVTASGALFANNGLAVVPGGDNASLKPTSQLTVHALSTQNYAAYLSTASIGGWGVAISTSGHFLTMGSTASVSSCGAGPAGSIVGDDNEGTITVGGGAVTSCTLTFANNWSVTPVCTISDNSTAITGDISSLSSTSMTMSFSASLGGGLIYYQCRCFGTGCL